MRGHKTNKLAGVGLLGAGLMYGRRLRAPARGSSPARVSVPARVEPARPTAIERALTFFPSLASRARPQITGEAAREAARGAVYAVHVYYHVDVGQDCRALTRLSSLTFPAEVEDWGAVEKVEVLFNDGSQADFYLKEGVVI